MNRMFVLALITTAAATACVQAQQPYRFQSVATEDAIGALARSFSAAGLDPELVDARTGIVQTAWATTNNFCARAEGNGKIIQRYTATLSPAGGTTDVVLRLDSKCCDPSTVEFADVQVRSGCVQMSHIFDFQQEALDQLGARIQSELGGSTALTSSTSI